MTCVFQQRPPRQRPLSTFSSGRFRQLSHLGCNVSFATQLLLWSAFEGGADVHEILLPKIEKGYFDILYNIGSSKCTERLYPGCHWKSQVFLWMPSSHWAKMLVFCGLFPMNPTSKADGLCSLFLCSCSQWLELRVTGTLPDSWKLSRCVAYQIFYPSTSHRVMSWWFMFVSGAPEVQMRRSWRISNCGGGSQIAGWS